MLYGCAANYIRVHLEAFTLLQGAVAVRTAKNLLAHIRLTEPGDVPRRLSMLDAALRIPAASHRLVVLLVFIVQVVSARLAAIHTVKAHAVEVSQRIGKCLQDDGLPVDATTAIALWGICVVKDLEAVHDLADTGVVENVIDWPSIALGEGELVATNCRVPAGT